MANYQATAKMRRPEQLQTLSKVVAGCSARPSCKAAASGEEASSPQYVEPLCAARTPLVALLNSLLREGGEMWPLWACTVNESEQGGAFAEHGAVHMLPEEVA